MQEQAEQRQQRHCVISPTLLKLMKAWPLFPAILHTCAYIYIHTHTCIYIYMHILTTPTTLFSLKSFDRYSHNIITVTTDAATLEIASHQGKVVCVLYLLTPWSLKESGSGESGRGVKCNSHICYRMEDFLITVFLMSNESSRNEAVCVQRDSLGLLSLSSYFQNQRFFLAAIFSICSLNFWARPACIWRLHRENQGRDTTLEVLTLRCGFFNCWERKEWKENTLYCCSQEFTLLNQDSADTHRLLSFHCAGCSSSFSTPTKAAVSFRHSLFPPNHPTLYKCYPCYPFFKHIQGP